MLIDVTAISYISNMILPQCNVLLLCNETDVQLTTVVNNKLN